MSKKHIVQIIPAEGWRAVFIYIRNDDDPDDAMWVDEADLVAWALVEEDDDGYDLGKDLQLGGLDTHGHLHFSSDPDPYDFCRFIPPGEEIDGLEAIDRVRHGLRKAKQKQQDE